jgi:hypothetical protein
VQQLVRSPWPPQYEVPRSCGRGALGRVISSQQGGQAIPSREFLTIPDTPKTVLQRSDQQRHLVANQGIGQKNVTDQFCPNSVSTLVGFFYIYGMGPTALLPLLRKACLRIFKALKNTSPPRSALNPRTLSPELRTQLLDHRGSLTQNHLQLNHCFMKKLTV